MATIFHRYERDRVSFVSAVADAARIEGNAAALAALGGPALLLPLLSTRLRRWHMQQRLPSDAWQATAAPWPTSWRALAL